jgi:hypothetical protein
LPALISLLVQEKRLLVRKTAIVKLGSHLDAIRPGQLLKTAVAMGTWAMAWQR